MTKQPIFTGFPHTVFATTKPRAQAAIRAARKRLFRNSLYGYSLMFDSILPGSFLAAIDPTKRQRSFGHIPVFWAWLAQLLEANASCTKGLSLIQSWCRVLGLPVPGSDTRAYCRARKRIEDTFLIQIDQRITQALNARIQPQNLWRGHHLKAIDGAKVTLMDTETNQKKYPQHSS